MDTGFLHESRAKILKSITFISLDRQHKGIDVACRQHGIACDFGGFGVQELSEGDKKAILSAYPRLDMKNQLTTCLYGIAKNHPNTTKDNFIADFGLKFIPGYTRPSSVDFLQSAPFAE